MKWIMLFLLYPLLPIMVGLMVNEAKPKKNIVVGVTLPFEARQTEEVSAVLAAYRKRMWIAFGLLTLAIVPSMLFAHSSVFFSWQMLWILLVMVVIFVLYARTHLRLRALKREHGWMGESAGKVLVEIGAGNAAPRWLSGWWFLPPILVSLVPIIALLLRPIDAALGVRLALYLTDALIAAGCYAAYRYLYRNRAEVVDEAVDITVALTRVRRYNWGKFWIGMAYLSGLFAIAMWLFLDSGLGVLITTCVYTAALLLLMLRTELVTRRVQFQLTQQSGRGVYVDDDAYWWLGAVYYNPNDTHTVINNRIGMGSTVNMARPVGKALLIFSLLCILLIPAMCGWMVAEEFTPIRVACAETAITADHLARVYTVPYDEIERVTLLTQLPNGSRIVGSAIGTLAKGTFQFNGIGMCEICLNTDQSLYLRVDTADTIYLFSADSEAETRAMYDRILVQTTGK